MRISDWSSDVCSSDLGSPLFQGVTLTMPNGKTLTIEAENNGPENVYIQSVTLNGQPHARTFLTHEALSQGGTLTFVMGPTPNKQWGSAPAAAPVSMTPAVKTLPGKGKNTWPSRTEEVRGGKRG